MGDNGFGLKIDKELEKEQKVFTYLKIKDDYKDNKESFFSEENQLKIFNLSAKEVAEYEPYYRGLKVLSKINKLDEKEKDYEIKRDGLLKGQNISEEKLLEISDIYEYQGEAETEEEIEQININWEQVKREELPDMEDTYFCALSVSLNVNYIGVAWDGKIQDEFELVEKEIKIKGHQGITHWLGYIDYNFPNITKPRIMDASSLLILKNQPAWNIDEDKDKKNYKGRANLIVNCSGTLRGEGNKRKILIKGAKIIKGNFNF